MLLADLPTMPTRESSSSVTSERDHPATNSRRGHVMICGVEMDAILWSEDFMVVRHVDSAESSDNPSSSTDMSAPSAKKLRPKPSQPRQRRRRRAQRRLPARRRPCPRRRSHKKDCFPEIVHERAHCPSPLLCAGRLH